MQNAPAYGFASPRPSSRKASGTPALGPPAFGPPAYGRVVPAPPHIPRDDPARLVAFAAAAARTGFREAARSALLRALTHAPTDPDLLTRYGQALLADRQFPEARDIFLRALAARPGFAAAYQGLGGALIGLGNALGADRAFRLGFARSALMRRARPGPGAAVLLLVSARDGNFPVAPLLNDPRFAVSAIATDYWHRREALPPHDLIINAIADADACDAALTGAEHLCRTSAAPCINPPALVRATGRAALAARLCGLPGIVVPEIRTLSRAALATLDWPRPFLLRATGFHTGQHFLEIGPGTDLAAAAETLPGETLLALTRLDARGADGMFRKFRMLFLGPRLLPLHLAHSHHWKVHACSAAIPSPAQAREEAQFLADPAGLLGPARMAALDRLRAALGLDYAGVDFAPGPNHSLLVFEANAAICLAVPRPQDAPAPRRAAIAAAQAEVRAAFLAAARRDAA